MNTAKPLSIMDATHGFAVPGSDTIIDCIHPKTGLSWVYGNTLEQIRVRYPGAEVVNIAEHCAAKAARQDAPVQWEEVTEERYWEMLEILPPACQLGGGFLVGEPTDHHAGNGRSRFDAFIKRGGKFFNSSRPMTIPEFKALYVPVSAQLATTTHN